MWQNTENVELLVIAYSAFAKDNIFYDTTTLGLIIN